MVALGLTAYALLFAEMFVRAFAPQSFVPRDIAPAPWGVRMNRPGAVYEQRTPEMMSIVSINANGLRADRDFTREKPAGVRRVAVFGDSYMLGYEASYAEMATTQIERTLVEAKCPVEVLNFAVSGFGTAEMLRTLEKDGLRYAPDVVLFQWHHTDPDDTLRANLYALKEGALVETGETYLPAMGARRAVEGNPLIRFIAGHSHLFTIVRERASRFVRRAMAGHVFSRKTTGGAAEERMAGPLDLAILARAESVSREAGATFFVVDVPSAPARMRFRSSFRLLPPEVAARPTYITPLEAFEKAAGPDQKLYWEKGHRHLTPRGNEVLASVVAARLLADPESYDALGCEGAPALPILASRAEP
ncbi:MAG: SGNH/GDSL hydrolase family protein [Parvularculaceae bacterium]|nr:SGNH/GDSL hydrolase family protein [Parvularculaceae bacterium]